MIFKDEKSGREEFGCGGIRMGVGESNERVWRMR